MSRYTAAQVRAERVACTYTVPNTYLREDLTEVMVDEEDISSYRGTVTYGHYSTSSTRSILWLLTEAEEESLVPSVRMEKTRL